MNLLFGAFLFFSSFSSEEKASGAVASPQCPDRPSMQLERIGLPDGDEGYNEFHFHSTIDGERLMLKHVSSWYQSDCNSTQAIMGHYEWRSDTLVLYKFWCHDGDYTGKEWGAYRARYKWVCDDDELKKIDAVVYLESLSDNGGAPLSTEDMKDKQLLQDREDFKRHTARREDADFVIGSEARALLKETKSAMKSILENVEASFDCQETGFGCRVWE